jgi:hypothetical protein
VEKELFLHSSKITAIFMELQDKEGADLLKFKFKVKAPLGLKAVL